jgi:hypothetical protein
MGELVCDDVEGPREAAEDGSITIAERELGAIPECVHVVHTHVHVADDLRAQIIVRVAIQVVLEVVPNITEILVHGIDVVVARRRIALLPHFGDLQNPLVLTIEDPSIRRLRSSRGGGAHERGHRDLHRSALAPPRLRLQGGGPDLGPQILLARTR